MDTEKIEVLTPEQIREAGAFIPELNGMTLWKRTLICEYCITILAEEVVILQYKGGTLHMMCTDCFRRLLASV